MAQTVNLITKKRIAFLFGCLALAIFLLIGRLGYLQFFQNAKLQKLALEQRMRPVPVEAKRGIIYDRNKNQLAVSVNVDSVYAVPSEIEDPQSVAARLAVILGLEKEEVLKKITQRQSFVWVKRKIENDQAKRIRDLKLTGIGLTQEGRRFYPKGSLASHILGFAGIDSQGLNGLEWSYDKYLRGNAGYLIAERDALGREIPEGMEKFFPAKDGNSLVLTIDEVIQHIVERELDKAVKMNKAKSGTIVVMDPKTGEVLALANKPDYDPNRFWQYKPELWRNDAVFYNYEPGSTFKIITAAAAIEEHVVKPDDSFYCSGGVTVGGHYVKCHLSSGHGAETFRSVVKNSCNPGFIQIGMKMGKEKFGQYIKNFGFGQLTGVEIQGESKGIVRSIKDTQPIDVATNSIGQGIAVTPIQLVTAVSAVANGGTLMRPLIVREIVDPKGGIVKNFNPIVVRKVVSPETAATVRMLLEDVVTPSGTGRNAVVEGYRLCGKTGTAQKAAAGGGYESSKYVASFVGFGPADNPRFVALVMIDEPTAGSYYGGQVAAPIFREIARDILRYLEIPPSASLAQLDSEQQKKKDENTIMVPNLMNLTLEDSKKEIERAGLRLRIVGKGRLSLDQTPAPGAKVAPGTMVIAYFKDNDSGAQEITVPYVLGKSMREAGTILGEMGLRMRPVGSGITIRQQPMPGAKVKAGTSIILHFAPSSADEKSKNKQPENILENKENNKEKDN